MNPGLWLRWSLRDLRRRWLQVAAIALVIALGTGTYTGLTSSSEWRRVSYDASYAVSGAHDLLVEVAPGTTTDRDALLAAIDRIEHPEWIEGVTTALAVPVQVDASSGGETILVPGRVVGVELDGSGATVDRLSTMAGRGLEVADAGRPVVVLDEHFRVLRGLPETGTLRLSGGQEVDWVGGALSPRYFILGPDTGAFFGAQGFAVLFTSLDYAQDLAGTPGAVTEAGVALAPGVDLEAARADLDAALGEHLDAAVSVTPLAEQTAYRMLYDDIEGDQKLYTIFAALILAGAVFAAFNLTGRIVESQRREIGVGMALGVPAPQLAIRPMLVAIEIAILGVVFGVAVGLAMGAALGGVIQSFFPMPVWEEPFQLGVYARGTTVAVGLVVAASAMPVWRAVRVDPVLAIRNGPRTRRPGGMAPLLARLALPGGSLMQMPLRDVVRRPRRTMLTSLGIAAMIATLIGVLGMVDSFVATIDTGEEAILGRAPDRVTVTMQTFGLEGSPETEAIGALDDVAAVSTGLRLGGTVSSGQERFDVLVDLVDVSGDAVYTPELVAGELDRPAPNLVLSRKAADDLGVDVGDTVAFRHPRREGLGYTWVDSELPVGAIHTNPYRFVAFMDADHAGLFELEGVINVIEVAPTPGADLERLRRELFGLPGVGSVQPVAESAQAIRDLIGQVLGVLVVVEVAVLLLAVLIAFNSSSIGADERRRDHATMFAFGVPARTVLGMAILESLIIGIVATVIGVLAGVALVQWMVSSLIPETLPELLIHRDVADSTFVSAALLGIVAVALAPVLTLRKLRRMDVPSTLRVME